MANPIIILGAGVSGLTLGWKLREAGHSVTILEASPSIGGLAGSVSEGTYRLDYGPHSFFSEDPEISEVFQNLFDGKLKPLTRRVEFFYKGKYLEYPFTPVGILTRMGLVSGIRATLSFLKQKIRDGGHHRTGEDDQSVEDWAMESFGGHLYRTFFKPYTEQFWKMPCSELSARSIPSHTRTNFMNTLRVLLNRKATQEGSTLVERERLPTYYPEAGYGELPAKIAQRFLKNGGEIKLNCSVKQVEIQGQNKVRVLCEEAGKETAFEGERVVSTIPLPAFIRMISPEPDFEVLNACEFLDYRPLVLLGMVTEKKNVLGDSMYIYQMDRPYNRIFESNKFSSLTSPEGENIVACELTCQKNSVVWRSTKEELFDMCIGSLSEDGILTPGDVKKLMLVKVPTAYPIYRKGYRQHLDRIFNYIEENDTLSVLGRTGEFRYMDADQCMRRAFDLAEKLNASNVIRKMSSDELV